MQAPPTNPQYSMQVDDARSRRRAELQMLQQKQAQSGVLARARSQMTSGESGAASATSSRTGAAPPLRGGGRPVAPPPDQGPPKRAPPIIPRPAPMDAAQKRTSDIFPGVEKVQPAPPKPAAQAGVSALAPPGSSPALPVVRRLDPSFAANNAAAQQQRPQDLRSKSAPRSRPPPPQPPSAASKEAPERPRPPPPVRNKSDQSEKTGSASSKTPPPKKGGPPPMQPPAGPPPPRPAQPGKEPPRAAPAPKPSSAPPHSQPAAKEVAPPPSRPTITPGPSGSSQPPQKEAMPPQPKQGDGAVPPVAPPTLKPPSGTSPPLTSQPPKKDIGQPPIPQSSSNAPGAKPAMPGRPKAATGPPTMAPGSALIPQAAVKPIASPFISLPQNQQNQNAKHTPSTTGAPQPDALAKDGSEHRRRGHNQPLTASQPPPVADQSQLAMSSARGEMLSSLREEAATPPIDNKGPRSLELRMQMELTRSEKAKAEALRKVAELEDEITQIKRSQTANEDLMALVQLAETRGEKVAIDWARKHASQIGAPGSQASLLIKMAGSPVSPRRRGNLPRPKRPPAQLERDYLVKAAERVEFEYIDDPVTYLVRRPYGLARERELWLAAGQLPSKGYEKRATVEKPMSIEVVALIGAERSLFVIYDEAMARHQNSKGKWEDFGDVSARETPLGTVTYIDQVGNENEFSLDDVFVGAIATREDYCSNVVSTASGLKVSESAMRRLSGAGAGAPPIQEPPEIKKLASSDACVGTEDIPFQPDKKSVKDSKKEDEKPKKDKLAPPPQDDSSDVMSVFFGMFFSGLLSLIRFIFIGLPLRILTTVLVIAASIFILCLARLYMMDDFGKATLGGSISVSYNQAGIM